jgi:hypothetical protein
MYLGLIISYNGIKMDSEKVAAIINWESVGTHDLRLISRNVVIVVLLGCMMIHCIKQTTWSIY